MNKVAVVLVKSNEANLEDRWVVRLVSNGETLITDRHPAPLKEAEFHAKALRKTLGLYRWWCCSLTYGKDPGYVSENDNFYFQAVDYHDALQLAIRHPFYEKNVGRLIGFSVNLHDGEDPGTSAKKT